MERRALFISLGLSLFAMYLVYQYVEGENLRLEDLYGKKNFYNIVIASRDILQFQTIRPTDVEVITVPKAVQAPLSITDPKDVVDSVAAIPLHKGEHILGNKIISKNIYSGLDTQISQGKRAISIPVNPKRGVGYLIEPGNRIDLAAHFEFKTDSKPISEVKVFMQDLLVLATGRTIQKEAPAGVDQGIIQDIISNRDKSKARDIAEVKETLNYAKAESEFPTLTLEVTPEQAQQIVYVMSVFQDSLIVFLRNGDDRQVSRVGTTNMDEIMGPESYFVRSKRPATPAPRRVPKYYDFVGGQAQPVY